MNAPTAPAPQNIQAGDARYLASQLTSQLVALLEGLEVKDIGFWADKPPAAFLILGQAVTKAAKRGSFIESQQEASALKRAMSHPRVLEIMADCADAIDAEESAITGEPTPYPDLAKKLREKSRKLYDEDPELWARDYPDGYR